MLPEVSSYGMKEPTLQHQGLLEKVLVGCRVPDPEAPKPVSTCVYFFLWRYSKLTWMRSCTMCSRWPCLRRVLDKMVSGGSFQPHPCASVLLWVLLQAVTSCTHFCPDILRWRNSTPYGLPYQGWGQCVSIWKGHTCGLPQTCLWSSAAVPITAQHSISTFIEIHHRHCENANPQHFHRVWYLGNTGRHKATPWDWTPWWSPPSWENMRSNCYKAK